MKITEEQIKAAESVKRALRKARRSGLNLRVYDGSVLLMTMEHLQDPDYLSVDGMRDWMDQCLDVSVIEADGGAGI